MPSFLLLTSTALSLTDTDTRHLPTCVYEALKVEDQMATYIG